MLQLRISFHKDKQQNTETEIRNYSEASKSKEYVGGGAIHPKIETEKAKIN